MAESDNISVSSASQWREAHGHWKKINISGQMGSWDDMYGLIVASKENSIAEKQRLVTTVKEFVGAYKTNPSQERVDAVLKFFRKYIGQLLERCDVAEKGFLTFYHTFSLVADPAELLLSAHTELMRQQRALAEMNSVILGMKIDNERLTASRDATEAALADLQENGDAPSALKQQLASLQDTLGEMQAEKKLLAQMLRTGELQTEKLKGDVTRLGAANSSLQDALSATTAKADEAISRAERESARLIDETEDANRQVEVLQDELARLKQRSMTAAHAGDAPSNLSAELTAMHQLCGRLETSCATSLAALEEERKVSARLATVLGQTESANASAEKRVVSPLSSSQEPVDPHFAAAAAFADAAESRKKVRELEREIMSQRLALAEARESLRTSNTTVDTLRRELAVFSAAPVDGAPGTAEVDDWATAFGGSPAGNRPVASPKTKTKPFASGGLLSESDFAELLADEGSKPTVETEGTNDGEDAHPDETSKIPSAPLVAALLAQRGVLKKRLVQAELQLSASRTEFQKARAKCEQLQADNAMLLNRVKSSSAAEGAMLRSADGFLGNHQVQLLLQERRAVCGRLDATETDAAIVTINGSDPSTASAGANAAAGGAKRRRAAVSQKLFSLVDHVAVAIANMLVFNKYTRAFLVCYILSLHLVVFAVLYVSSGRYMTRRPIAPVATAVPSIDGWR